MTSWFASAGLDLNSALDTLTETVQNVSESVSEAIPTEHKEFLAKITLNTDEMISERANFREEANRKAQAKDRLNKILPWGTLNPEMEILVEETKEAILELSGREETFFGPYEMPLLNVQLEASEEEEEVSFEPEQKVDSGDGVGQDDNVVEEKYSNDEVGSKPRVRHMPPSEESLEMLAKLKPLPPLLEEFDLDTHVGLIQRTMKEDPKLVAMQANFSGGGSREKTFWRNYFFHCAFTRYEAGLSLDEIWSYDGQASSIANHVENPSTDDGGDDGVVAPGSEEEVSDNGEHDGSFSHVEEPADSTVDMNSDAAGTKDTNLDELSELSPKNGFELVDDDIVGTVDPELDELEAEIARELEDM